MAKLINGNGNKAIWAAQDADLIAALAGNVTGIAKVGNKFVATQEDANTIGLSDGVIVTKEGRRIQLDAGSVDLFDIPTGTAGVTSYYIIGYHLITNSDSSQTCETFVQKMDNATDVITENTFRGGATEIYVSCYRVVQDGLNIDSINALLPELENISTLMSKLTDNTYVLSIKNVHSSIQSGGKIHVKKHNGVFQITSKLGYNPIVCAGSLPANTVLFEIDDPNNILPNNVNEYFGFNTMNASTGASNNSLMYHEHKIYATNAVSASNGASLAFGFTMF